jgi:hypothetical protein
METIVRIFAALGAGMILFALTYVTLLVGGIVNGMVVLISGPLVDKLPGSAKSLRLNPLRLMPPGCWPSGGPRRS